MASSEILYVKGMNISESEGESGADIWDDRKLKDAYEKAVKIANTEVAKRIAMSTNNAENKKGQASTKSNPPRHKTASKRSVFENSPKKCEWESGMPCRAIYEVDGLEYEAFVLRIINDKECVVRFLGYENSEIVPLTSLRPTLGKEARTQQIEQALIDKSDDGFATRPTNVGRMEFGSDRVPSPGSTERSFQRKKKPSKKKKSQDGPPQHGSHLPDMQLPMPNPNLLKHLGSVDMPMPPPPLMFAASNSTNSEDQAVTSMLLSWYMSGYYTGLYQGLRRAKESRRD